MPSEKATSRCSENRRCNKPIMEKRRRARINSCLNDLKALILEALKKDPARHSKLEKADILEMTVKHLQNLQRQQTALSAASNPRVTNKFRAGFTECAEEVSRFVGGHHGMDSAVRQRLLGHLTNCTNRLGLMQSLAMQQQQQQQQSFVPTLAMMADDNCTDSDTSTSGGVQQHLAHPHHQALFRGVQLVPTRLPNGDLALLLPANYSSGFDAATMASPPSTHAPVSPTRPTTADSRFDDHDFHPHRRPSFSSSSVHSLSGSSVGTASPSPPPPPPPPASGTRPTPTQQPSGDVTMVKREPLVLGMVERFRDECRTGSRLSPWVTGHSATHDDTLLREEGDREPWRPW